MSKLRLGVLASGNGSNLQAIMDAAHKGEIDATVAVVVCDHRDAYALVRAKQKGIPAYFVDFYSFEHKAAYEEEIIRILQKQQVDLVCLAGYMRIVSSVMLNAFPQRIMNIHPALLPSFPGLHGQQQAFLYGVKFSGCTVHFIDQGVDSGPIIAQAAVPVSEDDTVDSLAARILEQEHIIYPNAIQLYAEGRLKIVGRKVHVRGSRFEIRGSN